MQSADGVISMSSLSQNELQMVAAQLELILSSPLFRQSKRYPAFLRYVVEATLEGSGSEIKERSIGMEVFGRAPNYDTSMDPTVRLTAAEVRKRLAQYYHQPEHSLELHIELRPGSYVPVFSLPTRGEPPLAAPTTSLTESTDTSFPALTPEDAPALSLKPARPHATTRWMLFAAIGGLVLILTLVALLASRTRLLQPNTRNIWAPIMHDPNPAIFVLPDLSKTKYTPQIEETEATSILAHIRDNRVVDFNDSVALAQLSGMLGKWHKPYRVLLSSDTTFEDLQSGPAILIGAIDNPWTMRVLEPMPYSVVRRGDTMTFEIIDKKDSTQHDWSMDLNQPYGKVQQDFGIVARQIDTMTGRPVIVVAGMGQNATTAGIKLLTDPTFEHEITDGAPKGWSGRNLELVFRTQIINDKFGPPIIVKREYW